MLIHGRDSHLKRRTNAYDLLGRRMIAADPIGSTTNTFDYLGRLVASTNVFGQVFAATFDDESNVLVQVDANGVTITNTYDDLHRIRTRTFPDGGAEAFGYTANVSGPTSYTNTEVWSEDLSRALPS